MTKGSHMGRVAVFLANPTQSKPNWGLHLTPLRGAGEAGR